MVENARRKKIEPVNIRLELHVGHPANDEDADGFRNKRIRQKLIARWIAPEQLDVFRLEHLKSQGNHERQSAKQRRRETLLRGMRLQLRRHVQALAHEQRQI